MLKNNLKYSVIVIASLLVTGCQMVHSNESCGVLFNYSKEQQKKAALELEQLKLDGDFSNTILLVEDYAITRDTIRVCIDSD